VRALAFVLASVLVGHAALADEDRVLGGHTFVPVVLVPWSFIGTRAFIGWGGGYSWIDVTIPSTTGPATRQGRFATLALVAEARVKVLPWLDLSLGALGALQGGDDALGAFAIGMTEGLGPTFGATARFYDDHGLHLAADLGVAALWTKALTPSALTITFGPPLAFDATNLVSNGHIVSIAPSVVGAYAISRLVGLQAFVTFGVAEIERAGQSDSTGTFATAVALDIGDASRCPIGFTVGGRIGRAFAGAHPLSGGGLGGGPATHGFGELGVHYIGRRDLDLALDVGVDGGSGDVGLNGDLRFAAFW
jgi:hypothetical protein